MTVLEKWIKLKHKYDLYWYFHDNNKILFYLTIFMYSLTVKKKTTILMIYKLLNDVIARKSMN